MIKLKDLLKEAPYKQIGTNKNDGYILHGKDIPVEEDKNPCWKGYKQVGMKEKDGRQVPNCVPVEEELSEMKVNKSKVDKTYKSVLNHMRKVIKKLNDDEMYEVTTKLKQWFNKNIM